MFIIVATFPLSITFTHPDFHISSSLHGALPPCLAPPPITPHATTATSCSLCIKPPCLFLSPSHPVSSGHGSF